MTRRIESTTAANFLSFDENKPSTGTLINKTQREVIGALVVATEADDVYQMSASYVRYSVRVYEVVNGEERIKFTAARGLDAEGAERAYLATLITIGELLKLTKV